MSNRKILKMSRSGKSYHFLRLLLVVGFIFFTGACTALLPPPGTVSSLKDKGLLKQSLSDTDIMHEGITYLGCPGQPNDYGKARAAFESLLKAYPDSKWRRLSETLIHLIDTMQSCKEKDLLFSKAEEDKNRLSQENEKLRKDIRHLNDRLKTETSRLSEENEQLKNDIQLLKKLEIQLEKREKRFR
jgi:gas vesicle protein